jgi:hypothetical protein
MKNRRLGSILASRVKQLGIAQMGLSSATTVRIKSPIYCLSSSCLYMSPISQVCSYIDLLAPMLYFLASPLSPPWHKTQAFDLCLERITMRAFP